MVSLKSKIIFSKALLPKTFARICCLLLLPLVGTLSIARAQETQSGDAFSIPDSYKVEGIPPIKKSEVENLFYDPSTIRSNLIWDTDQKNRRMLVTDETNSVYLLDQPLGAPVKLIEKIVPQSVKMRPGGGSFAYTDDHEDEDNYQLYLYDFKEKTSKKLVALTGKDESVDSFVWSKSGDALFYMKVDYDQKVSRLCQYDFKGEKCYPTQLRGLWSVQDNKRNKVLIKHSKAASNHFLYVYDVNSDKMTPIDEKGDYDKGFFIGNSVIWVTEGNPSCKKSPCILSQSLDTNKLDQIVLPTNIENIIDIKLSPSGNKLMIRETKDGANQLRVLQIRKNKIIKEIPSFIAGSYVIWNNRWLSDNEIAYTIENISEPASIHSFAINSKRNTDWTKALLPEQLKHKVTAPEIFKWRSFDQKEISGFIIRPNLKEKKSPVLINVHGGPQILDTPVFNSQDIRFASNLGMTIIHTNIRGSSGFGNEFLNEDNQEKRGDAVKDIQTLLDWIKTQPELDANQIYLRGGSYGGFIVLSTALQEPERIRGVIAEYPLISIRGLLSQSWIDEFAKTEYGDPKDEMLMTKLDSLSPLNNTNRWNDIPLFLTRGKLDERTPENNVTDLKNQLQNKNSDVWFVYSTNDGHGFGSQYLTAAMYMFLKKQIDKENQKK